jgi:tetratricopeptide (TPR) repeat protein
LEPLLKRSLAIREKVRGPDHPDVATSVNNLAVLYRHQGRYADAEPLIKRALTIREKVFGPDHPNVAFLLSNLARLYRDQGRYADAEPLLIRSLAIREKSLGSDHPDVASSLNDLAAYYAIQGRHADALRMVRRTIAAATAAKNPAFPVLFESESQNLINSTEAFEASYTVLQRSSSSAAGKAVSQLAARFGAGSGELAQLVREDQDLTAEADRLDRNIVSAVSKPPADRNAALEEQTRKRISEIKAERDNLQKVFNQRFPDYVALSQPQPLSVTETQALLSDDEAFVVIDIDENAIGEDIRAATSYIWVMTRDRAEWKKLSANANDISKSVSTLRAALDPAPSKHFDVDLSYRLYKQILEPIEQVISGKTRLSFVLSGALTSLPPQVLVTADPEGKDLASVDWLVRKYAITVLPSVASLKVLRGGKSIVAAPKPMIGFGDPIFNKGLQVAAAAPQPVAFNRSLASFYRGMTADIKALAAALPPLPETADELRAVAVDLGAKPKT